MYHNNFPIREPRTINRPSRNLDEKNPVPKPLTTVKSTLKNWHFSNQAQFETLTLEFGK